MEKSKDQNAYIRRPLSRRLDNVFEIIGVNKKLIARRRQTWLQIECFESAVRSTGSPLFIKSTHYFGSQIEGTTTPDIKSDVDAVLCIRDFLVIEDHTQMTTDKFCLLLIQDKATSPGYCLLENCGYTLLIMHCVKDTKGRLFLTNSAEFMFIDNWNNSTTSRQGPASHFVNAFKQHFDVVNALPCKSWPKLIKRNFRELQRSRRWPDDNLVEEMIRSECFVVPTPSKEHPHSDVEWRISFSSAERLLMFNLNLTQIRCYILLKYVKKTVFDVIPKCENTISSYICKTTLFHTISQTPSDVWEGNDLLSCLNLCLVVLYNFISRVLCPHFIFPSNNLLLNRLVPESRNSLLDTLYNLIRSNGQYLFDIKLDKLGDLLRCPDEETPSFAHLSVEAELICQQTSHFVSYYVQTLCVEEQKYVFKYCISKVAKYFIQCQDYRAKTAATIFASLTGSILGSRMSSDCIQRGQCISNEAFLWLLIGVQSSDVMSAHLKFASALLSSHDLECTKLVLKRVQHRYKPESVALQCCCRSLCEIRASKLLYICLNLTTAYLPNEHLALCVFFTPSERYCIPKELQYEMYKLTFCKLKHERKISVFTKWMESATISPVVYMHFLNYEMNKRFGIVEESTKVMNSMLATDDDIKDPHLDTTLNLIGQILEQRGILKAAFLVFCKSLKLESQINAARILICCNICKQMKCSGQL